MPPSSKVSVWEVTRLADNGDAFGVPQNKDVPQHKEKDSDTNATRLRFMGRERQLAVGMRALVKYDGHSARIIHVLSRSPAGAPKSSAGEEPVMAVLRRDGARVLAEPLVRGARIAYEVTDAAACKHFPQLAWIVPRRSRTRPQATLRSLAGAADDAGALARASLAEQNIPIDFPPAALREAKAVRAPDAASRTDLRELSFVTIDPADARDHDDAICAQKLPNNAHRLFVAIADVAAFVRPGSALDEAAASRGNSVYLPNRVVPMLPERLSNGLCSLSAEEERYALVAQMDCDADGRLHAQKFLRARIRVAHQLSYEDAQSALDNKRTETNPALQPIWQAYQCLARARDKRAPLDLNLPETQIQLNPAGRAAAINLKPRLETHRLIEEFMICANRAAAEVLTQRGEPLLYRVHARPSVEKLALLARAAQTLGFKLPAPDKVTPATLNQLLQQAAKSGRDAFLSELVLRSQAQAVYAPRNIGHYGLALQDYAHFTSPIRRYSDIVVHRALIRACGLGAPEDKDEGESAPLDELGDQLSVTERRAMLAERQCRSRYAAQWASGHIGQTFAGRIVGLARAGLFVRLDDCPIEGLVPMRQLRGGYFRMIDDGLALQSAGGATFRLGDEVNVALVSTHTLNAEIALALRSRPRQETPRRRRYPRRDQRSRR